MSLWNDEENAKYSVINVKSGETLSNSVPVSDGIFDPRMGTFDHTYACKTCQSTREICPGHSGSINLRIPIQQPIAVANTRRMLRIICHSCGVSLVDLGAVKHLRKDRRLIEAAKAVTEDKICVNCNTPHVKVVKDTEDQFTFWTETSNMRGEVVRTKLYPWTIHTILSRVSMETAVALGKTAATHPRHYVMKVLPIAGVSIRPSVRMFNAKFGVTSHNDTNVMLQNIIKTNESLPLVIPSVVDPDLDKSIYVLQQGI